MLTPSDISKASNVSGYRQVGLVRGPSRGNTSSYYQAYEAGGRGGDWKGPARSTAQEAAQDYCDRVNSGAASPPRNLKRAGHVRPAPRKVSKPSEVEAAEGILRDFRAQQDGEQGYVYCFREKEGIERYVKIGYSTNPQKRIAEVQTGNPRVLEIVGYFEGTEADERAMHAKHAASNKLQEWFRPTPALLSKFTKEAKKNVHR